MKYRAVHCFVLTIAGVCLLGINAHAQTNVPSTYKHITIDGSFGDWTGVPLAYTAAVGSSDAIQYENVYLANDDSNIYIRFTLYSARPDALVNSYDNIFIDADNNAGTGYSVGGIGSELLIQGGAGYQEKGGTFNDGYGINGLGWTIVGSPDSTDFELAISRTAAYASDSTSVFTNNTIAVLLEGDDTGYNNVEFVPPSGGFVYSFATAPTPLSTNLPLVTLTGSSWQANASGTDLGTNWLDQNYDDSGAGWTPGNGLFGYTSSPGSYPPINTALSSGPNTYYFRTHFEWTNDSANVAFVVTNYLSDGAVYYVNGAEVRRIRMPSGAVSYSTAAAGTNSPTGQADIFGIEGGILKPGDNILEVETHQAPSSSGDLVFGLSLTAAVSYPPLIVNPGLPADHTVLAGQPVTFTSDILASGPASYQWYFNGTIPIPGANGPAYTIPQVLTNNAGTYSLFVSNALSTGVTTRAALLTVSNTPITINAEPADGVAVEGKPFTFTFDISGTPLIQYQWYFDGNPIPDETNATYTITSCLPVNSGTYQVKVSNPASATNSRVASLAVLADTIPPNLVNISAGAGQIVVTFSEPVDSATASQASKYSVSGGVNVTSATPNPNNAAQVTLTTGVGMNLGTVYSLTVNGVNDLFGNSAHVTGQFARGITIDGSFDDWTGLSPIYSTGGPSGNTGAADFKDIYVYNDADYYYFRVTLWTDIDPGAGQFPDYVNMFFDTDNDPSTGYAAFGSDMLVQSGFAYQEKDGGFNDGYGINNLNWLCLPATPGTNFEFQMSRAATFGEDGTPVFATNVLNFIFQGMTSGFVVVNTVPTDGSSIQYPDVASASVPALPLGKLAIGKVSANQAAVFWDPPGTLQYSTSLNGTWTNLPAASNPYVIPATGGAEFFRLSQ